MKSSRFILLPARIPEMFMKAKIHFLAGALAVLSTFSTHAGYVNTTFVAGSNFFSNPLSNSGHDTLNNLLFYQIPTGTTISLWNPTNSTFDTTSTFTNGSWTTNLTLEPGTGALLNTTLGFTNTFVGTALNHEGGPIQGDFPFPPPPLFSGPSGLYLLADKCPISNTGTNIFINILGRAPFVGEQVIQLSATNTYLGNGTWDAMPTLGVGKAAFLKVITGPVPWLTILVQNNQTIVSWPSSVAGWTLQTNNNLVTGVWGNYAGVVINNSVTNITSGESLFFRLSHP